MSVTLQNIADELNVSRMTVSRALRGTGVLAPATRDRILERARMMGYRPHAGARFMNERRNRQVGLLLKNEPSDRFVFHGGFELMLGLNEVLEVADHLLSVVRVTDVREDWRAQAKAFRENILDGLVVVHELPADLKSQLKGWFRACAWFDPATSHETGCLLRNDERVGREAAAYLCRHGARRLVWVGKPTIARYHHSVMRRFAGVRTVIDGTGVALDKVEIPSAGMFSAYHKQLHALLSPETGFIAYDEQHARWIAAAAGEVGCIAGRDFRLVSCDGSHISDVEWPGLSRMSFDLVEAGRICGRMILSMLSDADPPSSKQLESTWIEGNTGRLAG